MAGGNHKKGREPQKGEGTKFLKFSGGRQKGEDYDF